MKNAIYAGWRPTEHEIAQPYDQGKEEIGGEERGQGKKTVSFHRMIYYYSILPHLDDK